MINRPVINSPTLSDMYFQFRGVTGDLQVPAILCGQTAASLYKAVIVQPPVSPTNTSLPTKSIPRDGFFARARARSRVRLATFRSGLVGFSLIQPSRLGGAIALRLSRRVGARLRNQTL